MATLGSLFSGFGLLDLGLSLVGFDPIWHAELTPAASRVLEAHWPGVPNLGDVTAVDWSTVEVPDVLCGGGWPCQPFSDAGLRLGATDDRYLWPEVARALRVLRPRHFVMEQSPALLARRFRDIWLTVLADLAEAGFDAEWAVVRASDVGACHQRRRLFLVAHADPHGRGLEIGGERDRDPVQGTADRCAQRDDVDGRGPAPADAGSAPGSPFARSPHGDEAGDAGGGPDAADLARGGREAAPDAADDDRAGGGPHGDGGLDLRTVVADAQHARPLCAEGRLSVGELGERSDAAPDPPSDAGRFGDGDGLPAREWGPYRQAIARWERVLGEPAPSPLDEKGRLNVELVRWMMGAPPGWHGDLSRTAAIKGYGNGVVVQLAERLGRWVQA